MQQILDQPWEAFAVCLAIGYYGLSCWNPAALFRVTQFIFGNAHVFSLGQSGSCPTQTRLTEEQEGSTPAFVLLSKPHSKHQREEGAATFVHT